MVIELAELETIELRIALQWLGYMMGEVIAEAVILSMGARVLALPMAAQVYSQSRCR